MVAAFRDEEHYRRLLKKHGMEGWQGLPRLWLQTLDRDVMKNTCDGSADPSMEPFN